MNESDKKVIDAYKRLESGKAVFIENDEAKQLMKPTSIRIKPTLKLKIEAMAREEDRSFNNMVARLLESAVA